MPWWSWILIWIALVALFLLLHVLLGIRLFRQFMSTVRALESAGEQLTRLTPLEAGPESDTAAKQLTPGSAVFAPPEQMRHDYLTSKSSRTEMRRQRRVERKTDWGRPQSLRDIEIS